MRPSEQKDPVNTQLQQAEGFQLGSYSPRPGYHTGMRIFSVWAVLVNMQQGTNSPHFDNATSGADRTMLKKLHKVVLYTMNILCDLVSTDVLCMIRKKNMKQLCTLN